MVGISILLVVIPMNALTRSALLLVDLAIVIDIVYHSTWTHYWKPRAKLSMTSLCVCGYLAIATILILREHQTARLKLEGYVESESFLRLLLFAAGVFTMYVLFKLRVLISWYFELRRKERLAMAARFRYAEKGWLDYRVESENSSERLFILTRRTANGTFKVAGILKHACWFLQHPKSIQVTRGLSYFVAARLNKRAARLKADLEDLELATELFIKSTEGHLKTSNQDFARLEFANRYFKEQLLQLRDDSKDLPELLRVFREFKGYSQVLTAASNRHFDLWKSRTATIKKLELHCARMVKLTEVSRDDVLAKTLKAQATNFPEAVESMS